MKCSAVINQLIGPILQAEFINKYFIPLFRKTAERKLKW